MLDELKRELRRYANPERAALSSRFFKTGPGQYGEGDKFLGVAVPDQRVVVRQFVSLPLPLTEELLHSDWHEDRLTAVLIMVAQHKRGGNAQRQEIYEFYIANASRINNWDLVDSSARDIVGGHVYDHPELLPVLDRLASSPILWERRIAVVATHFFLIKGEPDVTIKIIETLLHDNEDLIHKATGWTLREMGKRVDQQLLINFLDKHASQMQRTMLRYAIEHLSPATRQHYMRARD